MKEFSKFNYLSYDTLFVKIGLILFSNKNHKVWQFSVSRKYHENELVRKVLTFLVCAFNIDVWFVKKLEYYYRAISFPQYKTKIFRIHLV